MSDIGRARSFFPGGLKPPPQKGSENLQVILLFCLVEDTALNGTEAS